MKCRLSSSGCLCQECESDEPHCEMLGLSVNHQSRFSGWEYHASESTRLGWPNLASESTRLGWPNLASESTRLGWPNLASESTRLGWPNLASESTHLGLPNHASECTFFFSFFIIQRVKARVILCPHLPPAKHSFSSSRRYCHSWCYQAAFAIGQGI